MITRRKFIRDTGLIFAAAGTGYFSGILSSKAENFVLQGLLPDDEQIFRRLINALNEKIKISSDPVVLAEGLNSKKYSTLFSQNIRRGGSGQVVIRINKLKEKTLSDILISDSGNVLYNPKFDYSSVFNTLREDLRNRKADIFFSLEYSRQDWFDSLTANIKRTVIVQDKKGIAEKINLEQDYSDIHVTGLSGKLSLEIKNGMVSVKNSCCRNKICIHSGYITQPGSLIACAPQKIIISIVNS
jgi:hypothetical protein